MIEFVDGPCGWNRMAPTRLRRQARGGVSAWQTYSTARFLERSDPTVLHTSGFPDVEFDSGMQIELLPDAIAARWRSMELQFATDTDIIDMAFPQVLTQSLDLIRAVCPLLGTVAGLCRSLHVLFASDLDFDSSYSDPSLPFSVFVSCPLLMEVNRVERLAESIVHEALHLQLSLVETAEPLVINTPDEMRVFSPWKNEQRTVRGLVHGVYVFGNLRYFWACISKIFAEHSSFAERRIETIDNELGAAKNLATNPTLTWIGQRLVTSLLVSPSEPASGAGFGIPNSATTHGESLRDQSSSKPNDGVVKLTGLDLLKLQSRALRLRVGATR